MSRRHVFIFVSIIATTFLCVFAAHIAHSSREEADDDLTIHFLDVGQGDCIFINLPDGKNILIDVGSPSAGPKIVKYLKSLDIQKIDHLIFTHPDEDHIGGIFSILSEFKVGNFHDNGFSNFTSNIYGDYIKHVRGDLPKYNILQAGEQFLFGDVSIEVLNPLLPPTGSRNNDSIVLRLSYGDIRALLAGDLEELGERRLLKYGAKLTSQILKVGHHGENDSCSYDFLKSVKPEIAIISVGGINKNAQPHQQVLTRLKQTGTEIYRTDLNGNTVLITGGRSYTISVEK